MKVYEKPDLYYEDFELSTHVATCAWDMSNNKNKYECSAQSDADIIGLGDVFLFTKADVCNLFEEDYEDYCYTNGDSKNNVFNS